MSEQKQLQEEAAAVRRNMVSALGEMVQKRVWTHHELDMYERMADVLNSIAAPASCPYESLEAIGGVGSYAAVDPVKQPAS